MLLFSRRKGGAAKQGLSWNAMTPILFPNKLTVWMIERYMLHLDTSIQYFMKSGFMEVSGIS